MLQRITDTCHTEGQPIVSNRADDLRVFLVAKEMYIVLLNFLLACEDMPMVFWFGGQV